MLPTTTYGTPQRGPFSRLLSNFLLTDLDLNLEMERELERELERRGHAQQCGPKTERYCPLSGAVRPFAPFALGW